MEISALKLTKEDVEGMDPEMIVRQWNKLQDQLREEIGKRNREMNDLHLQLGVKNGQLALRNQALANVAERMIRLGVLEALTLNIQGGDDENR